MKIQTTLLELETTLARLLGQDKVEIDLIQIDKKIAPKFEQRFTFEYDEGAEISLLKKEIESIKNIDFHGKTEAMKKLREITRKYMPAGTTMSLQYAKAAIENWSNWIAFVQRRYFFPTSLDTSRWMDTTFLPPTVAYR